MAQELQLVRSDMFEGVEYDIYTDNKEMYMTSEQLGKCLGFSNGRKGIDNIVARNEYLNSPEFSTTLKLRAVDDKTRDVRVFTEDGIYEITMLAKTDIAREFRAKIRKILKGIRAGEINCKKASSVLTAEERKRRDELHRSRLENERINLKNREKEIELNAQNEAAKIEERRRAAEQREKQRSIDALLELSKDKKLSGAAKSEIMAKIYEMAAGETLSSSAMNDLFNVSDDAEIAAHRALLDLINRNPEQFNGSWGIMKDGAACILKPKFDEICKELNIAPKPFQQWLKDNRYIEIDKQGQSTVVKYFNGKTARCVCLIMELPEKA